MRANTVQDTFRVKAHYIVHIDVGSDCTVNVVGS